MNDLINIENKILVIRGQQVMLDRDLAGLYGVETKRINEAVKRNIDRFPKTFCFQLTENEYAFLRSQFATSKKSETRGGRQYLPYAFTEQGVAMLSAVLHSKIAVQVSIDIMNAFVVMRRFLFSNAQVFQRLDRIEAKQLETDQKLETIFTLMDKYKIEDKQGVFVQGQIFDAYTKFQELIQKAKTLIKKLDVAKFNAQYPSLTIKNTSTMHDRFLIIDRSEIFHIGASIKDLGKKCFGFTRLEDPRWIKIVLNAL